MAGAKHFRELVAWQLAREIRRAVSALVNRPAVRTDFDFVRQLRDAARGPARNIAEGFGRFRPRDFSRFLTIATASLNETENHLEEGIDLDYWTREALEDLFVVCRRAGSAPRHRARTKGTRTRTRTEPVEPGEPEEPAEPAEPA